MNNMFSTNSDVTVVLTSCGRFDLLAKTLQSFFAHNTYPLKAFLIIEDSGKSDIENHIPKSVRQHVSVLANPRPIGQLASIDKAYAEVTTPYIFHCEDDWLFYRPGFIEHSKTVLETESCALMVWLRSYHHDFAYYGTCSLLLNERKTTADVAYYRISSAISPDISGNQCFSFNPGLRRSAQCPDNGYAALVANGKSPTDVEIAASKKYHADGYFAVLLENDAVKHIGFGRHTQHHETRWKKYRSRLARLIMVAAAFAFGWWFGISW